MWRLTNIYAENFCSFKELSLPVAQNVATLVFGNNMDDASQNSNGSGKSALVDVIALGITGAPFRELKTADEIIRDDAEEAVVALIFDNTNGSRLEVKRLLSRKNPQQIQIFINSEEIPTASVLEANNFVLETLGLSKDDIYSNFILSKTKYKSFLSSSDKDKKNLINRFSNGIMVDQSIEALQADIEPLRTELIEIEKRVSYSQGQLSTIDSQIKELVDNSATTKANLQSRLAKIDEDIVANRKVIRESGKLIDQLRDSRKEINGIMQQTEELSNNNMAMTEAVESLYSIWNVEYFGDCPDYMAKVTQYHDAIESVSSKYDELSEKIKSFKLTVDESAVKLEETVAEFIAMFSASTEEKELLKKQIDQLKEELEGFDREYADLCSRKNKGAAYIQSLKNMLAGTIECPKCHHQWVSESDMTIEEIKTKLTSAQNRMDSIDKSIDEVIDDTSNARKESSEAQSKIAEIQRNCSEKQDAKDYLVKKHRAIELELSGMKDELSRLEIERGKLQQKVQTSRYLAFQDALAKMDYGAASIERKIKGAKQQIEVAEGALIALKNSKEQLMKNAPEKFLSMMYEAKAKIEETLASELKAKQETESRLNNLLVQEARFMEFKTYLANSKIEAISAITNQFLEAIGSDIRLSFSGITMLKSGKIRDKISISMLRDGIDCGSYGKFSQGERSRCELATILALQKLINTNCEDDKGLDLLVIDEVMDGTDETGLSHIFETLNNLQVTSLVISHGAIQESYQPRLIVNKQNGVSFI